MALLNMLLYSYIEYIVSWWCYLQAHRGPRGAGEFSLAMNSCLMRPNQPKRHAR